MSRVQISHVAPYMRRYTDEGQDMSTASKDKKKEQLGMDCSTAANRLKKQIMFAYVKRCGDDECFRCGEKIESESELSVEHKIPWLDSDDPKGLFFDFDNIAFSHLICNTKASRPPKPKPLKHGTMHAYNRRGCRCEPCRDAKIKVNSARRR